MRSEGYGTWFVCLCLCVRSRFLPDAIIEAEHFIVTDIKQVICWRGGTAITVINWYHQFDDRRFCIMNNRTNNIPQRSDSRNLGWYSELTTSSS